MIVAELPYETADPTVDSQIVSLKASGADVFFNVTTPKFAAQAIKKAAEIGWKPVHLLNNVSTSVGVGAQARRARERQGHPRRPATSRTRPIRRWKDDRRHEGMARLHGQVLSGRRQDLELHGLRLRGRADAGAGAQAVRRRPHARERDEAGREPEGFRARHAAARHQGQHQPDRLLPDRADADAALQRRALGVVRPDHDAARSAAEREKCY